MVNQFDRRCLFFPLQKIEAKAPVILPADKASLDLIAGTALAMASDAFADGLSVKVSSEFPFTPKWNLVRQEPFSLVVAGDGGSDLSTVLAAAEGRSPFTLIPLSAKWGNTTAIVECLNEGFVPCGFDRNVNNDGHPVLLLGKLREGTLLAPIKIVNGLLSSNVEAAIRRINQSFKSSVRVGMGVRSRVMVS